MNVPNKLTMMRIAMVPLFAACFYIPFDWANAVAAAVFLLACLTDMLDGRYARKHNMITDFGKLMDPIADKLLTGAAVIFMLARGLYVPVFGEIFVFITVGREFIVSGIRLVAASEGNVIAAAPLGKIKTVLQFVTIMVILLDGYVLSEQIKTITDCTLMCAASAAAVWSLADYAIGYSRKK